MTTLFSLAAFAAGLAAIGWVGAGYLHAQPLALAIIVLITAFYLLGSWELLRFARASRALAAALAGLSEAPQRLDDWLSALPAGLRNAVRQRVEGGRTSLPGPLLASYLTGLLVLLGMLGTFGGMVLALNGTGAALAGAEGLDAMRDALSAPVRGLALAFGSSMAGVAASAMLGLMTALCRRERIRVARTLDAAMAGALRPFSSQHQREASLRLLEQQTGVMPQVVTGLKDCMAALERQQQALAERLAAEQQRFYRETETAYTALAATVQRTLADTAAQSAAQAGAAIQPVTEATLAALARESARLQQAMAQQVGDQLDAMAARFAEATSAVSTQWTDALHEHRATGEATAQALEASLARFTQGFEQRTTALADDLAARLTQHSDTQAARWDQALERQTAMAAGFAEAASAVSGQWTDALQEHRATGEATAQALEASLTRFTQGFEQRTAALADDLAERLSRHSDSQAARWDQALERQTAMAAGFAEAASAVSGQWTSALQEHRATGEATAQALEASLARFTQGFEQRTAALADDMAARLAQQSDAQAARWDAALQQQGSALALLAERQQQSLQCATDGLAGHAAALQSTVQQAHDELQGRLAAQEGERLAQWTQALQTVAATLTEEWQAAGAQAAVQQQRTSDALASAAGEIARQMQAQAQGTLAEVQRLVHAAAEAPRAAAEAMGALRQQISDSIARDNAMLDERARLVETLSTLLDAAGRAADEQRGAIDTLVAQAAASMERTGGQFAQTLDAQAEHLEGLAAQLTAGATEVASLGEAFGGAVQLFGQASEQMLAQLQRIEEAMARSLTRSDEQLDYYVAQAREVIELSVGAQKQIIDGLQQVAAQRAEEPVA
ncbi:DUF802 domain-containing protein [Oryzisolibacter sp. LB2S]|uniref:DUF802 domain-containing protein n=1 Tax=Alicycliphilus soli TaxID=3228789 RepID=UPI00345AA46D